MPLGEEAAKAKRAITEAIDTGKLIAGGNGGN